ncbi:MAG: ribosome small subunit-dependent GTPase A [Clostridiales bacterium]|nr:ribosome small subunit-dependent GTPase A [Clostridiales bacterium]
MIKQGIILKGISGFYYVECDNTVYECKAKGVFRRQNIKPVAGDRVTISVNESAENIIEQVLPRKNYFERPCVSNIDKLFVIVSSCEPSPVPLIIDRIIASAVLKDIEPVVVLTKSDLMDNPVKGIYKSVGIKEYSVSSVTGKGVEEIKKELSGCLSAFCGNSGVGKSSLLNAIDPSLNLKTDRISQKLGRGKHTTRECELFRVSGGMVADTPGFSSFDFKNDVIPAEQVEDCFPEFKKYIHDCLFTSCRHIKDKGCAVKGAVNSGLIPVSRYESYCSLYLDSVQVNPWDQKKK